MAKRPERFRVPKIKIDLSEWDLGDWPDDVHKLMKVKTEKNEFSSVTIELDLHEAYDAVARKIVKQGIEAFFGEGFALYFSEKGVEILGDPENTMEPAAIIPWDSTALWLKSPAAIKFIQEWIEREKEGFDDDEEESRST